MIFTCTTKEKLMSPPLIIKKSLSADAILWNLVTAGLRECIRAHGPIGTSNSDIGSATKRIISNIINSEEFKKQCPEDLYNKLIVKTLKLIHKQEIFSKDRLIRALGDQLREKELTTPAPVVPKYCQVEN